MFRRIYFCLFTLHKIGAAICIHYQLQVHVPCRPPHFLIVAPIASGGASILTTICSGASLATPPTWLITPPKLTKSFSLAKNENSTFVPWKEGWEFRCGGYMALHR